MFDTVGISTDLRRPPNFDLLVENGCVPFYSKFNGEPYKLVLNAELGAKEPRLTISKNPGAERNASAPLWYLMGEFSIGSWIYGSNIYLPTSDDIDRVQKDYSDFVYYKTGIQINTSHQRLNRLDVTLDTYVGETRVFEIIKSLSNFPLSKYFRRPFQDTSVTFQNKGKKVSKKIIVYSKYHDLLAKGASKEELELARGIFRLEVQHEDNRAVAYLAKSLKLSNHSVANLLNKETHEKVIGKAMKLLGLDELIDKSKDDLEILSETYGLETALKLSGHLQFQARFGSDYLKLPGANLSPKTLKEYNRKCLKVGISS